MARDLETRKEINDLKSMREGSRIKVTDKLGKPPTLAVNGRKWIYSKPLRGGIKPQKMEKTRENKG